MEPIAKIIVEVFPNGQLKASWQNAHGFNEILMYGMLERAKMQIAEYFRKLEQQQDNRIMVPEMKLMQK